MNTLPNFISILRLPLAFLFLSQGIYIRLAAVVLAMLSDVLDGFIARRYRQTSLFGTLLDPVMDRFFVTFAVVVLYFEGLLTLPQSLALFSRDFSVVLFGLYLVIRGRLCRYHFRAIWCGKLTTAFQFFLILALIFGYSIPSSLFSIFVVIGAVAFAEVYIIARDSRPPKEA